MVIPISQYDPRWAEYYIGYSRCKMKNYGCYISCLCMALMKLRGSWCDPRDAVHHWNFKASGEFLMSSNLKGGTIKKKANYFDIKEVRKYANEKDKAAILALGEGEHYVFVDRVENEVMTIIDPLGAIYKTIRGTIINNKKIMGMRLLEADEMPIPEWTEEAVAVAKKHGLESNALLEINTIMEMQKVLLELGVIDKITPKEEQTVAWLCTVIGKIKERY